MSADRQGVGVRVLACGCVLGSERCFDCRPGLHKDQETAVAMTTAENEILSIMREWLWAKKRVTGEGRDSQQHFDVMGMEEAAKRIVAALTGKPTP